MENVRFRMVLPMVLPIRPEVVNYYERPKVLIHIHIINIYIYNVIFITKTQCMSKYVWTQL